MEEKSLLFLGSLSFWPELFVPRPRDPPTRSQASQAMAGLHRQSPTVVELAGDRWRPLGDAAAGYEILVVGVGGQWREREGCIDSYDRREGQKTPTTNQRDKKD